MIKLIDQQTAVLEMDWLPTPGNINNLPEPLKRFIHDLTTCCPSELVAENHALRSNIEGLKIMVENLKKATTQ